MTEEFVVRPNRRERVLPDSLTNHVAVSLERPNGTPKYKNVDYVETWKT